MSKQEPYITTATVKNANIVIVQGMAFVRNVLCKDCKHFIADDYSHCGLHHHLADRLDFCSWGEQK